MTEERAPYEAVEGMFAPPVNDAPPQPAVVEAVTIFLVSCPTCRSTLYSSDQALWRDRVLWTRGEMTGERTCPACGQRVALAAPGAGEGDG